MKIVQSFWSKPSFHENQQFNNNRQFGGWLNFRYFVLSSCYSCLTLKKQNKEIDFFTDSNGYGLFIDELNLPYDFVSKDLDRLSNEDHRLWIRGKMIAIQAQQKPFIHVDNDVYMWEQLPSSNSSKYLVAQSIIPMSAIYKQSLSEVQLNFDQIPKCLMDKPNEGALAANVGIIGGNDIDFFREFYEASEILLESNRNKLKNIDIGGFNQIMEEYLFFALARAKGRKIDYYIDSSKDKVIYESVLNLSLAKVKYKYIHLIGSFNKQNYYNCEQIELRLKYEFPEYYKKISILLNDKYHLPKNELLVFRHDLISRSLKILYELPLHEIMHKKIRIVSGSKIVSLHDYSYSDTFFSIVKEADPSNAKHSYRMLPYYPDFVKHFEELFAKPISMAEIIAHFDGIEDNKLTDCADMVLDSISKYLLFGLLEFSNT